MAEPVRKDYIPGKGYQPRTAESTNLKAPTQEPGESWESYKARLKAHKDTQEKKADPPPVAKTTEYVENETFTPPSKKPGESLGDYAKREKEARDAFNKKQGQKKAMKAETK